MYMNGNNVPDVSENYEEKNVVVVVLNGELMTRV